jgi:uncharacterized membrane-anchored protein YjiN (DUF445 family)
MSEAQSDLIILFATNLTSGCLISPNNLRLAMKIHKLIQNLKERVMQHVEEEKYRTFNSLKRNHNEAITNNETPLMQFLISNLNRMLSDLQKMRRHNRKSTIGSGKLFQSCWKFHSEIGNMVRSSMMKLNNKEVEQIEEKVSDLQYIRLNGAVVGIVGIIIAVLKLL